MVFLKRNLLLSFFALALTMSGVFAEKIDFINKVAPNGTMCFLENIGESIQAVVNVKSASEKLILTVSDPKGTKLQTIHREMEMRYHFAAFDSGNYQICIQSLD